MHHHQLLFQASISEESKMIDGKTKRERKKRVVSMLEIQSAHRMQPCGCHTCYPVLDRDTLKSLIPGDLGPHL